MNLGTRWGLWYEEDGEDYNGSVRDFRSSHGDLGFRDLYEGAALIGCFFL